MRVALTRSGREPLLMSVQASARNRLLSLLSHSDFALLADDLEPVDCPRGFTIVEPHSVVTHVYFPESGVGSIIATSPEGQKVEASVFGRDGFSPVCTILGSDRTPNLVVMQIGGACLRIAVDRLGQAAEASPTLRGLLLRYVQTLHVQASYTALS